MPSEGGEPFTRGGIPQMDGLPTPTGEGAPIRTERNTRDTGSTPDEGVTCVAGGDIPQPDGIVPTPTSEGGAIWTENNAPDIFCMPDEGGESFAGDSIPQPDGIVLTPTSESPPIRTERLRCSSAWL